MLNDEILGAESERGLCVKNRMSYVYDFNSRGYRICIQEIKMEQEREAHDLTEEISPVDKVSKPAQKSFAYVEPNTWVPIKIHGNHLDMQIKMEHKVE